MTPTYAELAEHKGHVVNMTKAAGFWRTPKAAAWRAVTRVVKNGTLNHRSQNSWATNRNSWTHVRADCDNAQEKQAVLAQWQSSGFVNSAGSSSAQGREHSEKAGASRPPAPPGTVRTIGSRCES